LPTIKQIYEDGVSIDMHISNFEFLRTFDAKSIAFVSIIDLSLVAMPKCSQPQMETLATTTLERIRCTIIGRIVSEQLVHRDILNYM
jgi:hypothetical protein